MRLLKNFLLVILCALGAYPSLNGQCSFQIDQVIPDADTFQYPFEVFGLVNDMLSNPAQGICSVTLDFDHEYLGDFQIELVSPSGQSVQLVGPVTTAISPTNLSRWRLTFLPCGSVVVPDAGFADIYSNDQAWQILTNYNGSYYPNSGCLEDFDIGSANGSWSLRVIDGGSTAIGTIHSMEIQFCDNNGSVCTECEANAGSFQTQNITICEDEVLDTTLVQPQYLSSQMPESSRYAYLYVVQQNGVILNVGDINSISLYSPGQYSLCGLSVSVTDTSEVMNILDTSSFNSLIQLIESPSSIYCADLSDNCIALTVETLPIATEIQENICQGDTIRNGGQSYFESGTYEIRFPNVTGCDSIVMLTIQINPIEARIEIPDRINCADPRVTLDGSNSIISGNPSYRWFTLGGTIVSNPNRDTLRIAERERYFLIASDGNCADTTFVDVIGDETYPVVFTNDGILDCNQNAASLQAEALPANATFQWQLPDGSVIQNQQSIQAIMPGSYIVEATNTDGCSSVDTAQVGIDTIRPSIRIDFLLKNCESQTTTFRGQPSSSLFSYRWSGPNSFMSNSRTINAPGQGYFVLEVTDQNGCSSVDSIFNDADYLIPDIDAMAMDSLGCGTSGIQIFGNTSSVGSSFSWAGPQGFSSAVQNPFVLSPGSYFVTIQSSNECINMDTVEVYQGSDIFPFTITADTISCKKDSAIIGINGPDLFIDWVDLPDSIALNSFVTVYNPGTYQAIMVDTVSGCSQFAEVEVIPDLRVPSFGFIRDTIRCSNPVGTFTINPTGTTRVDSITWTFPNQTISYDSIIETNFPGRHFVLVKGENGCTRSASFIPVFDTLAPIVFTDAPEMGCVDSIQILSLSADSISTYAWTGLDAFTSDIAHPFVYDTGRYLLTVTSINGCSSTTFADVSPDMEPPDFSFQDETLDCIQPFAEIASVPTDSVISYVWFQNSDTLSLDSILNVNRPGLYYHIVTGTNFCQNLDSIFIDGPVFPSIHLLPDTITCDQAAVQFSANNLNGPATYMWSDLNQTILSMDSTLVVSQGDSIQLRLVGENGCIADTLFSPEIDTIAPTSFISQLDEILCQERMVRLDASTSIGSLLDFSWQTSNGEIISGQSDSIAMVNDTGLYVLILLDQANGCRDTASFELNVSPNSIFNMYYSVSQPACTGDSNGSIEVDSLDGGSGGYTFSLDGVTQSSSVFQSLSAGIYLLSVVDTVGCLFDTMVVIPETVPVSVELGDPKVVYIGEFASITAQIDFDSNLITNISWNPDIGFEGCPNCLTYEASPLESTTFTVMIEDSLGCVISDNVLVQVIEKGNIYVPNIFTPNGDQQNDLVQIFAGPGITEYDFFGIFDRWGNQVFGAQNFTYAELANISWDGKLKNEELMPAVFTYIVKYRLINGKEETKTGDILLLR